MNKFQIENPETSYKDDCWTLFMGRRPPGDLKLAPAVAEGYVRAVAGMNVKHFTT